MKNVYIYIMLLLISFISFGQETIDVNSLLIPPTQGPIGGVDVVFFIDNSDSMMSKESGTTQNREYEDLKITVQNLMTNVLACNSDNRVAVVQFSYRNYGVNGTSEERPRIYIEGNGAFTNTPISFSRRFNNDAGYTFACLDLLGNVLAGVPNPSGPQRVYGAQTLNSTPGNKLIVCMITDAGLVGNDLFPNNSSGNTAYASYTNFKNNLDAKLVIIQGPSTDIVQHNGLTEGLKSMSAGISSRQGSYGGSVYSYSSDPDGAGITGRKFLATGNDYDYVYVFPGYPDAYNDANFLLDSVQIQIVTDFICVESPIICYENLLISQPYNVASGEQKTMQSSGTIVAENIIENGGNASYHAAKTVVLESGFHGKSGSLFIGYIQGCDGDEEPCEICPRPANTAELYKEESDTELFTLSPNPATDNLTISSDKVMQNITVTSMDGTTYFSGNPKTTSLELNITNYPKGIYVINVITIDGETEIKKLIKN